MQINIKKSMKFVTLLIFAAIIGTVSAATYSYMYIQGSGSITSTKMSWVLGADGTAAGGSIDGVYVKTLNFSIPADTPQNFTDALHLINNEPSTPHTFSIAAVVTGGSPSSFTTFDMVVYQSGGARVAKISVKNSESTSGLSINGGSTLYVRFEVVPVTGQTTGSMAFTVTLTYE